MSPSLRPPHRLRLSLFVLLASLGTTAPAADLAARRSGFEQALAVAERRPLSEYAAVAAPYADHPLAPYLEYAVLRRQLAQIDASAVQDFITRHPDLPVNAGLRADALRALAKREDWVGFRRLYTGSQDAVLRCADLRSRRDTMPRAEWLDGIQALWLSGRSQPDQCDVLFAELASAGRLTQERRIERAELAAAEFELGLIRYLARGLPAPQAALLQSWASYLEAPTEAPTATWPSDARHRRIAVLGLNRLAQRDPGAAEALLASLQDRLGLGAAQRGEVRNRIALWSAASYLPDSAARFSRVPADAWDARLHEWQVREALARRDFAGAQAALQAMSTEQGADARWRYLTARLREISGEDVRADYATLAREPTYFGFLAADRIGVSYALCPLDEKPGHALRRRLETRPGFVRAMELFAIGRVPWARREWEALKSTLPDDERRAAVALAEAREWFDRGPFTLTTGEDLRYYRLRFPLPHARRITSEARKYGLDPAWVTALVRAESAWAPDARSHANARGLMQMLPATARQEARLRGIGYRDDASLYQPEVNLELGIAHLATMLKKHGDQPFLATAAYNAGPTPVARWLAQRPPQDIDLWIETIPYRETREYVARILAFATIYDWRLDKKALPVLARAQGQIHAPRRGFSCPEAPAAPATGP